MSVLTIHPVHPSKALAAGVAAAAILSAAGIAAISAGSGSSEPAPFAPARVVSVDAPRPGPAQVGSADALERRAATSRELVGSDRLRFGSADAAERQLSR